MKLKINKPLAFIDIETTGIDVATDRIVEISIIKIFPDEKEETKTFRINPTIPIPLQAQKIHGIKDEDVRDKPTFPEIAKSLAQYLNDCDLAGYNSNKFDIPLLMEEFLRTEVEFDMNKRKCIDVQVIFHKMEQRTLTAAYKFYCNKELINAHTSEADSRATYEILQAQLDKYSQLTNSTDTLCEFSSGPKNADFAGRIVYDENGTEIFNFGKHKGKTVEEVLKKEPGYYSWIMNGDFPLYTKKVLTSIKLRSFDNKLKT